MSQAEKLYLLAAAYVVGLPLFWALVCWADEEVTWGHIFMGFIIGWVAPYFAACVLIALSPIMLCEWIGKKIGNRWPSIYSWSIRTPRWACRVAFRCKR